MKTLWLSLIAFAALFPGPISAQVPGETHHVRYKSGSEEGLVILRSNGVLEWRGADEETVYLQPPIDPGRGLLWLGKGRRFLVSGLYRQLSQGKLLLVELQDDPARIQILSEVTGGMDITSVYFSRRDSAIYVIDIRKAAILRAPFRSGADALPEFTEFELIIDGDGFPLLERRIGLTLFKPYEKQETGLTVWDSLLHNEEPYRVEEIDGSWKAAQGEPFPPDYWGGPDFYGPAQGPLYSYVPARAYEVVRDDLPGDAQVVSSGDFGPPEKDPPIGETVALEIPSEGLVPGARYHIRNVEKLEGVENEVLPSGSFTPLFRSGYTVAGSGIEMGQGFTSNRSTLGSSEFKAAVHIDRVPATLAEEEFDLYLYWALKDEGGNHPISGFDKIALLTKPLGAWRRSVTVSKKGFPFRYMDAPLTDPRLKVGELIYFQFAMSVDASNVLLSDVFATTIFEPTKPQDPALATDHSGSSLDAMQLEVWQRARDLLRARQSLETGK